MTNDTMVIGCWKCGGGIIFPITHGKGTGYEYELEDAITDPVLLQDLKDAHGYCPHCYTPFRVVFAAWVVENFKDEEEKLDWQVTPREEWRREHEARALSGTNPTGSDSDMASNEDSTASSPSSNPYEIGSSGTT
jgi:hypothetical protein